MKNKKEANLIAIGFQITQSSIFSADICGMACARSHKSLEEWTRNELNCPGMSSL